MRWLVLALAVGTGVQPTTQPRDARVVRLDAVVVDGNGRPVGDLNAGDFDLRIDDVPVPIDRARLVRGDGPHVFALFLDEYHVGSERTDRARAAALRLVDDYLRPDDAVFVLKPLDSLTAENLSTDRMGIRAAIHAFEGRLGDLEPRTAFEHSHIADDPAHVEAARAQISISALNALVIRLGTMGELRTSLVVVSEGFADPLPRRRDALPTMGAVARAANSHSVAVYQIDPRDRTTWAGHEADRGNTLADLTEATGGRIVPVGPTLDVGLDRLVTDARSYYVVEFEAPRRPLDGRFHRIELSTAQSDTAVRTRSGYYASSPSDVVRAPGAAVPPSAAAMARRKSSLINPWFGLSRGNSGLTRIRIVWEPVDDFSAAGSRRQPPAQVTLMASTLEGDELFRGVVRPWEPAAGPGAIGGSPEAVFDAPAGRLLLQMSVEDATAATIDTDVRDLNVRAMTGPLVLGTAEVLRARTARAFRGLEADPRSVPAPAREFSRAERLLIRVPVYTSALDVLVDAHLSSRIGRVMRDLAVGVAEGSDVRQVEVPLAGLAPGVYSVEVIASAAGRRVVEEVTFRVTP